jgi:hypothetical protein
MQNEEDPQANNTDDEQIQPSCAFRRLEIWIFTRQGTGEISPVGRLSGDRLRFWVRNLVSHLREEYGEIPIK